MESHRGFVYARDLTELDAVMRLIPRAGGCVKCDATSTLECPNCSEGTECQFTIPSDCTECSQARCVAPSAEPNEGNNSDDSSGGPNIGAIVGGVVGGIVLITVLTYLAWRYLIKPRRAEDIARHSQYHGSIAPQDSEKDHESRHARRSSTHTVHSIASTVLTRASNIIQIAYIPGVTNRANPASSGVLVPPVPPIPMQHSANDGDGDNNDQHFFVPGDLRDSTYSGLSGYSDRTSYATRTSYAPRSSIASTIYGKQAQVMNPASTGLRAKPTMVSVKSMGTSGSGGTAPPVPNIDFEKFGNGRPKSGASTFSVGSTFLNTATQTRAQVVKVGGLKKVEIPAKSDASSRATSTSEGKEAGSEAASPAVTPPTLSINDSPFVDPLEEVSTPEPKANAPKLGAVMEDDEDRPDRDSKPASIERGSSPFGDEHATR